MFYNKFISCLYMFRAHVLIIRRSNCVTQPLVSSHSVGCRPVQRLREDLSQPVQGTATYRYDDTRGCVIQFWPPDDEHMCSKHVEAWNKLIVKQRFCASSWLITEINIKSIVLIQRVSFIVSPSKAALTQRKRLPSLGHTVTPAVLLETIKGTLCVV